MISVNDKEKILEELGGLPVEIYDELVAEHFALVKDKVDELKALLEEGDFEEFRRVAHYVKSSSANLRLTPFQELGAAMENASKGPIDRQILEQSMAMLEQLIASVDAEGHL
jgi:HPt (histidine-containing phosphotransfer) domain-containing protein